MRSAILIDTSGSAAVEFGIVAGTLLLLTMASIDLGLYMLASTGIEAGVLAASRFGVTGIASDVEPGGGDLTRRERIESIILRRSLGLIDPVDISIETRVYGSFAAVGTPEQFDDDNGNGTRDAGETFQDINGNGEWDDDVGVGGDGGPGDIVLYRVECPWTALTPLMRPFLDGTRIVATVAVRNEPW